MSKKFMVCLFCLMMLLCVTGCNEKNEESSTNTSENKAVEKKTYSISDFVGTWDNEGVSITFNENGTYTQSTTDYDAKFELDGEWLVIYNRVGNRVPLHFEIRDNKLYLDGIGLFNKK